MTAVRSENQHVNLDFLDFEAPIAELEEKIEELKLVGTDSEVNVAEEVARLSKRSEELTRQIFAKLKPWQISKIARHPRRPLTLDYVKGLFTDIEELHGDRMYADDPSIVSGIARFKGIGVAFIGHQKGRSTKENLKRNFGMPKPEGYRKAIRVMKLAERFRLPIITFIDTPGAYPGIGAEERGQSQAIAQNLLVMSDLKVPIIASIIGEGGSGGALAIGMGDRILMLEYATYSVISPEGCASILWKNAEKSAEAADAMGITAARLSAMNLVDTVVLEPLGGAHRKPDDAIERLGIELERNLLALKELDFSELVTSRQQRYFDIGEYSEN